MRSLFIYKKLFVLLLVFSSLSCKKFIDIAPPADQLINPLPFENDATATSVIAGIYSEMVNGSQLFSNGYTTLFAGMSADELNFYTPGFRDEFVSNELSMNNHTNINTYFWKPAYKFIYAANLAIEQLNLSKSLTPTLKNSLLGEAKFMRAFCYFNLVNLFGDVPLPLTPDYRVNQNLPRATIDDVYKQIIIDLKDAREMLSATYVTLERARPNKWSAAALLARVYLYRGDWLSAETEATSIIASGTYSLPANLNSVFTKTSNEVIWQLQPVTPNFNTHEGNAILPASTSDVPKYLLTTQLLNSFETNDLRKAAWTASRVYNGQTLYYPRKYKIYNGSVVTEYYVVFRLAEIYLIRAEARAQQNLLALAKADLDQIRTRAGLSGIVVTTQNAMLKAIEQERKIELFSEWGHRWFDIKRTGRANVLLAPIKPLWQATDVLWPIPFQQIDLNPQITQNPGY